MLDGSPFLHYKEIYFSQRNHETIYDLRLDSIDSSNIDYVSLLGILDSGYSYTSGTIDRNIRRLSWLQSYENGNIIDHSKDLPKHQNRRLDLDTIAKTLFDLLKKEILLKVIGYERVYILLSGGLDSRITLLAYTALLEDENIPVPICVTWGLENSKDVQYAKRITEILGYDWVYLPLEPYNLLYNIDNEFRSTYGLVSPVHYHRMDWFKNIDRASLVIASSYGDSIGRGVFSGEHITEVRNIKARNYLNLLNKAKAEIAITKSKEEINKFEQFDDPSGRNEIMYQGIYMRNMISQAMSVIDQYCDLYQVFTHPMVYSFIWSLDKYLRNDGIYYQILNSVYPVLKDIPWSKNKKKVLDNDTKYLNSFHNYSHWISNELFDDIIDRIDMKYLASLEVFNLKNINKLINHIKGKNDILGFLPYADIVYLAALCNLNRNIENRKHQQALSYEERFDLLEIASNADLLHKFRKKIPFRNYYRIKNFAYEKKL